MSSESEAKKMAKEKVRVTKRNKVWMKRGAQAGGGLVSVFLVFLFLWLALSG